MPMFTTKPLTTTGKACWKTYSNKWELSSVRRKMWHPASCLGALTEISAHLCGSRHSSPGDGQSRAGRLEILRQMVKENPKIVAIGEIGLDYYYLNSPKDIQKDWFGRQIELAGELDLPIIIHDRDAHGDTVSILKEHADKKLRGILHCYSGSYETAETLIQMGFYISFAGPVVFPKSTALKEVARRLPLSKMLVETDSPI